MPGLRTYYAGDLPGGRAAGALLSGHLLGEGGIAAWVEVLLPADDNLAMPFDPTNHRRPTSATPSGVGRDYPMSRRPRAYAHRPADRQQARRPDTHRIRDGVIHSCTQSEVVPF